MANLVIARRRSDGKLVELLTDDNDKLEVSASVTVSGSGLATEAKQDTGNSSLSSIVSALAAALPSPRSAPTNKTISAVINTNPTPGQGPNQACVVGAYICNPSTNTSIVYVGGSTTTGTSGQELSPGDTWFAFCSNLNQIYAQSSGAAQTLQAVAF